MLTNKKLMISSIRLHKKNTIYKTPNIKVRCNTEMVVRIYDDPKSICMNCKHYRPKKNTNNGICTHITSSSVDIISGKLYFDDAYTMRKNETRCGLNARYYESEIKIVTKIRTLFLLEQFSSFLECINIYLYVFLVILVIGFLNECVKYNG